jgi:hypothetical protein
MSEISWRIDGRRPLLDIVILPPDPAICEPSTQER